MATIGGLPVGAVVKSLGTTYNGVVIRWLVGHQDTANGRTKLITEKIITLKCFDAREPSNTNSYRKQYGNNRYMLSNIDQWLNSSAGSGAWYSARHTYDAPPNEYNVYGTYYGTYFVGYNEYDAEAGFLANFEESFRNAILDTTIRVARNPTADFTGYDDIIRKVYLLSRTEVGLGDENNIAEGSKWDLFSDNNSRKAYPTAEAVSRSEYTHSDLNASLPWDWWLRTQNSENPSWVRCVTDGGSSYYYYAYYGHEGVRPALELDSGIFVSNTPDTDGAYIIRWGWAPPSIYPRIGGVSRAYSDGSVKIDGVWRTIDEVHVKVGGVWRKS